MRNKLFILLFFLFPLLQAHPIHVSVTNITLNDEQTMAFFNIKTYVDDLDLLFVHHEMYNVKFSDHKMNIADSAALYDYLVNSVALTNAGPIQNLKVEFEELSIWITFTMPFESVNDSINLKNTWLLDLYHDQSNLVFIGDVNNEETLIFTRQNREKTFVMH